jgi:hypothetical protein
MRRDAHHGGDRRIAVLPGLEKLRLLGSDRDGFPRRSACKDRWVVSVAESGVAGLEHLVGASSVVLFHPVWDGDEAGEQSTLIVEAGGVLLGREASTEGCPHVVETRQSLKRARRHHVLDVNDVGRVEVVTVDGVDDVSDAVSLNSDRVRMQNEKLSGTHRSVTGRDDRVGVAAED